jgi:hypothetical protein
MSGIAIISTTEYGTTMIRLVHEGKVIDRIEVDSVINADEKEIAGEGALKIAREICGLRRKVND